MCVLSGPNNHSYLCQFLPSFWRRQERERQRKVNRWTAVVLGLTYRTVQPAAGSLISLPLFPSKILLPPSLRCDVPVGFWNTEIARVLFYLSGIQWEFPLQPTAGSGMSSDFPHRSPLISSHPYPPLALHGFFYSALPLCSPPLPTLAHVLSLSRIMSFCLFIFSGMAVSRRLTWGEQLLSAKAHKLLTANTKSCCGDMAKLDLFTLSPSLTFIISLSLAPLHVGGSPLFILIYVSGDCCTS